MFKVWIKFTADAVAKFREVKIFRDADGIERAVGTRTSLSKNLYRPVSLLIPPYVGLEMEIFDYCSLLKTESIEIRRRGGVIVGVTWPPVPDEWIPEFKTYDAACAWCEADVERVETWLLSSGWRDVSDSDDTSNPDFNPFDRPPTDEEIQPFSTETVPADYKELLEKHLASEV